MNKNFSMQSFKASASNASDFLKNKGYEIPRSLMLNTLSVFLGLKNWNTAQSILNSQTQEKESNDITKFNNGLILISSKDPQKIIDYIHEKISIDLLKKTENKKILRSQVHEKYYKNLDVKIYDTLIKKSAFSIITSTGFETYYKGNSKEVIKNFLRRRPDYTILDLLTESKQIRFALEAASTGMLMFLGVELKETESAKEQLFNSLLQSGSITFNDALWIDDIVKHVIYLD